MVLARFRIVFLLSLICTFWGCANIVPPTGGTKDTTPPRLLSVTPKDSLLNTRVSKVELRFDEFIVLADVNNEVQIAPLLKVPLNVEAFSKRVVLKIPDSLLLNNTTYRISFGKAIRDLHEDNPFIGYNYIFSTGGYFDSLMLEGDVFDAFTGKKDTGATVLLYPASLSDSVVVREKPMYAVKAGPTGHFSFKGLPYREFRIYALKDGNGNLIYDGGGEMVAFRDSTIFPADSFVASLTLNLFQEADSFGASSKTGKGRTIKPARQSVVADAADDQDAEKTDEAPEEDAQADNGFNYSLNVDTTDTRKRTFDITVPLEIVFNRNIADFNKGRIHVFYDSLGILAETDFKLTQDSARKNVLRLKPSWQQNALYTIRLLKGFARDSAAKDAMPSKYSFRTKRDEDYAKLHIHLPAKYYGDGYILVVMKDNDTIHHQAVRDTMVNLVHLAPGAYSFKVVEDRNRNGHWDTGDLLARLQPETVIPYSTVINLKAGWENLIDFEEVKTKRVTPAQSPRTRDTPRKE